MKIVAFFLFTFLFVFIFNDCGGGNPTPPPPHVVVSEKELMIIDPAVVDSSEATTPTGAFSIKTLLDNMAPSGKDAKEMMLSFLTKWETEQTVNSFKIKARPNIKTLVIDPWKKRDGQPNATNADWKMNFSNAPFRLLAIVNRIDLHRRDSSNKVLNAGEGRFVFGVLNDAGNPLSFTVIFEYEQQAKSEKELKKWATDWHHLGTFNAFDQKYIDALKAVTAKFTGKGIMSGKPNGSALNQLRTNERAIGSPWELRELTLNTTGFEQATTKQTPDITFNNKAALETFIKANAADIQAGKHKVPLKLPNGKPFLAGNSPASNSFWNTPNTIDSEVRHKFSLNTCNACHSRETNTNGFLHVSNRAKDKPAVLSGFLKGVDVIDPVDGVTKRNLNDLKVRIEILTVLVKGGKFVGPLNKKLLDRVNRVH